MPFTGTAIAQPRQWQADAPLDPAAWIPLVELALEGFGYADTLDARLRNLRHDLAEEILLDDIGRACVARSVARQMFANRAQKQLDEHAQRAAEKAAAAAAGNPLRERVRALQRRETLGDPLADMKHDEFNQSWDRVAAQRDEINSGALVYHSVRDEQES